jgi:hypothetical protein
MSMECGVEDVDIGQLCCRINKELGPSGAADCLKRASARCGSIKII